MVALCLLRRVNGQERGTGLGLHKTVCVCVCVCACVCWACLWISSVKALIGCHSHSVSKLKITASSQVSLRVETCSAVTYSGVNGPALPTTCTHTHTHTHTETVLSSFSPLYFFVYLVCNETRKSPADLCSAVILSETASPRKESMQEITSQMRYFSYRLCSICPISRNNHTINYL